MKDYAVSVENLTVRFGSFVAVNDISFSVNVGEIFGFLGANGAGKTTTIRALCGLLKATSGKISVAGRSPEEGLNPIKQIVGYMSQRFTLYDDLTVAENISFSGSLRKMAPAKLKERTEQIFRNIDFTLPVSTPVKDLPGGIKQRLALAVSMIHDPAILFLDEPTSGVSPAARVRFWNLIRKIAAAGKTVFVTTHYMDEAEQCDRISLMRDGKIIALDSPSGLKSLAFPEAFYEAEAVSSADLNWSERLRMSPEVQGFKVHGLRRHFELAKGCDPDRLARETAVSIRKISPSLEDVFLKFVEGRA